MTESEKKLYYNYKKVFQFRKLCLFLRESLRNFFLRSLFQKLLSQPTKNVKFLIFRLSKFPPEI